MNWLISPAQAAEAGAQAQPDWWGWVWLAFLIVFFYFFLIRPQRKREKAQAALMAALNKGDEVVTQAGLVGVIAKVEDDFVQVKVGPTTLRFQKAAVIGALPKGTLEQFDDEECCAAPKPIEAEPVSAPSDNVVRDSQARFRLFSLEGLALAILAVPPASLIGAAWYNLSAGFWFGVEDLVATATGSLWLTWVLWPFAAAYLLWWWRSRR